MRRRARHAGLVGLLALATTPAVLAASPALPVLGTTERISLRLDGAQATRSTGGSLQAHNTVISAGGRYAVFQTNLDLGFPRCRPRGYGIGMGSDHIYLRDLQTGRMELISGTPEGCLGVQVTRQEGASLSMSADGRYVAFTSQDDRLDPTKWLCTRKIDCLLESQVFLRDRVHKRTIHVSVGIDGKRANGVSFSPSVSNDGRFVVFESRATNLVPGDKTDPNSNRDEVYLRDLRTGTTRVVGPNTRGKGRGGKYGAGISGNGRWVVFTGDDNDLVPHKGIGGLRPARRLGAHPQVYVWDRVTGRTEHVSRNKAGYIGDGINATSAADRKISDDGRWIVFASDSGSLLDEWPSVDRLPLGWTGIQVYLHDRVTKDIVLVSAVGGLVPGLNPVLPEPPEPCLSADGQWVVYRSYAQALGDVDPTPQAPEADSGLDIYLWDRATRTNRLVSRSSLGIPGDKDSTIGCPANGGKTVVFASQASTLVTDDSNTHPDVFVRRYS